MSYTKTGPFNNGAAPAINKAFLDALETFLTRTVDGGDAAAGSPVPVWNGSAWTYKKLTTNEIDPAAGILKSQLAALGIVDADVAVGAAIAYSKLALAASIVNADIGTAAAIAYSKLALGASIKDSDIASAQNLTKLSGATGTPSASTFLRGDGEWSNISTAITSQSSALTSDVTMTTANTFYDGPSMSCAAGTWLLIASVLVSGVAASDTVTAKLWNGTTVAASTQRDVATNGIIGVSPLVAVVSPGSTTTYKVSVACNGSSGTIKAAATVNGAGNNASTLVGIKIA